MSQSLSTLQMQVLAAMREIGGNYHAGTTDMDIGDQMVGKGVKLSCHNTSYPVVCLTLGKLKKLDLVERKGNPDSWGTWFLTDEGKFLAEGYELPA